MTSPLLDTHTWIFIVASCRVLGLPLLTRDARILRSRLVTRWRG